MCSSDLAGHGADTDELSPFSDEAQLVQELWNPWRARLAKNNLQDPVRRYTDGLARSLDSLPAGANVCRRTKSFSKPTISRCAAEKSGASAAKSGRTTQLRSRTSKHRAGDFMGQKGDTVEETRGQANTVVAPSEG